jgi:hypothetical protein
MPSTVFDLEQAAAFLCKEARRHEARGDRMMAWTALDHANALDRIADNTRAAMTTVEPCYRCADVPVGE